MMEMSIQPGIGDSSLHEQMTAAVQHLIDSDFQKLIQILYRVDVSEAKLKNLLSTSEAFDPANAIASLIIERQMEKMKTRNEFRRSDDQIDEDEKF